MDAKVEGLTVLSREECLALVAGVEIGRIGFELGGVPHVLPVNCAVSGDGAVVFRTEPTSVLAQIGGRPVVFEVDGFEPISRTGWSVCIRGLGRDINSATDQVARRLLDLTVLPWAPGQRERWFAVPPEEVTGRRIPMVRADFGWIPGVVS